MQRVDKLKSTAWWGYTANTLFNPHLGQVPQESLRRPPHPKPCLSLPKVSLPTYISFVLYLRCFLHCVCEIHLCFLQTGVCFTRCSVILHCMNRYQWLYASYCCWAFGALYSLGLSRVWEASLVQAAHLVSLLCLCEPVAHEEELPLGEGELSRLIYRKGQGNGEAQVCFKAQKKPRENWHERVLCISECTPGPPWRQCPKGSARHELANKTPRHPCGQPYGPPPLPGLFVPKILDIWERGASKGTSSGLCGNHLPSSLLQIPKPSSEKQVFPAELRGTAFLERRVTGML